MYRRIQANTDKILLDVLVANRMKRLHPHSFNIILELPAVHVHDPAETVRNSQ